MQPRRILALICLAAVLFAALIPGVALPLCAVLAPLFLLTAAPGFTRLRRTVEGRRALPAAFFWIPVPRPPPAR